jgi:hypothetical protein
MTVTVKGEGRRWEPPLASIEPLVTVTALTCNALLVQQRTHKPLENGSVRLTDTWIREKCALTLHVPFDSLPSKDSPLSLCC